MAKGKKETNYLDEFVTPMDEVNRAGEMSKGIEDTRGEYRERAEEAKREYAFNVLKRVNPEYFNGKKVEDLTQKEINTGYNAGVLVAREDASNIFSGNLEDIVDKLSNNNLEDIARVEGVLDSVPAEGGELVTAYRGYNGIKNIVERYDKGKPISEKELGILTKMASEHKAKVISDKFKDYSPKVRDAMAEIGRISVTQEDIKKSGEKIVLENKKAYEALVNKNGRDIGDYVKESIIKLGRSEDAEEFQKAMGMVYQAVTGKLKVK